MIYYIQKLGLENVTFHTSSNPHFSFSSLKLPLKYFLQFSRFFNHGHYPSSLEIYYQDVASSIVNLTNIDTGNQSFTYLKIDKSAKHVVGIEMPKRFSRNLKFLFWRIESTKSHG